MRVASKRVWKYIGTANQNWFPWRKSTALIRVADILITDILSQVGPPQLIKYDLLVTGVRLMTWIK